ncbi:hypothetical protein Dvina_07995 [Dactylosporangium vinaceum]|nr:hypothetical protein Dvina_07995 [Dactylosporangium vinaceum]
MAAEVAFVDPITCLAAPAAWLPEGLFVDGVRILSRWDVLVDGAAPTPVSSHRAGASSAVFSAVAAGPELTVVRRRLAEPMGGTETITLSNAADVPMTVTVTVLAEALASARIETTPPCAGTPLTWTAEVPPRGSWQVEARITRTDIPPTARPKRFSTLRVTADDPRLDALVRAGVQDLDALRRTAGPDAYYSTSSPSHLTLSPREALWAARLALPLGHDVAAGTLRLVANAITADLAPLFTATRAAAIRWGMPPDAAPPGPASNRAPASNPAPAGTSGNSVDPAAVVGDRASVFGASDAVSEGGDAGSGRADAGSVGGDEGSGRADAGSVGGTGLRARGRGLCGRERGLRARGRGLCGRERGLRARGRGLRGRERGLQRSGRGLRGCGRGLRGRGCGRRRPSGSRRRPGRGIRETGRGLPGLGRGVRGPIGGLPNPSRDRRSPGRGGAPRLPPADVRRHRVRASPCVRRRDRPGDPGRAAGPGRGRARGSDHVRPADPVPGGHFPRPRPEDCRRLT